MQPDGVHELLVEVLRADSRQRPVHQIALLVGVRLHEAVPDDLEEAISSGVSTETRWIVWKLKF